MRSRVEFASRKQNVFRLNNMSECWGAFKPGLSFAANLNETSKTSMVKAKTEQKRVSRSPLRAGTSNPVGGAEACKVKICVPHRRKSGLSPL